jgi:hypothetical protein
MVITRIQADRMLSKIEPHWLYTVIKDILEEKELCNNLLHHFC